MTPQDELLAELATPRLTAASRRIAEVASELFYARGIHAVGVDTIAAASGVTKRTLYDRFGSKDRLVVVALQLRHERWWARLERHPKNHPGSPVLALFDSYTEPFQTRDRGCAFINAAAELPADHPAYRVIRAHKGLLLLRLVEAIRKERALDEAAARDLAQEIFLLLEGALAHRGMDGDDRQVARARATTARLISDRDADVASARP